MNHLKGYDAWKTRSPDDERDRNDDKPQCPCCDPGIHVIRRADGVWFCDVCCEPLTDEECSS